MGSKIIVSTRVRIQTEDFPRSRSEEKVLWEGQNTHWPELV